MAEKRFKRNKLLGCFVTEQEKRFVKQTAKSLGLSMSEFLRGALLAVIAQLQHEDTEAEA